ncbi:probable serpin E3 [Trichomycterus rosablanca]|uniref:probable serpin E3 n=1 Tax=Trichomycterus rosablanca TaxID=2290929 RepID=UPI002F358FC3
MNLLYMAHFFPCLWLIRGSPCKSNPTTSYDAKFGISLYRILAEIEDGSNLIMSPASISLSLVLLQIGARGNTLAQLEGTTGSNINDVCFQDVLSQTIDDLENSSHSVWLQVTNTLFIQSGFQLLPEFTKHVRLWCNSSLLNINFTSHPSYHNDLNQTHSGFQRQTPSKGELIENKEEMEKAFWLPAMPPMTILSAVEFQGAWQKQFLFAETKNLPFYLVDGSTVKVPMMYQSTEVKFGQFCLPSDQRYSVLELPYLGQSLSLLVVVPSERKTSLSQLEAQLTSRTMAFWDTGLRHTKMDIFFPRFKMHSRFNLKPVLQSLGISDAFNPSTADFSGISDRERLYVSAAMHEASIEVKEEGTRAAAATAMVLLKRSRAPVFKADRPFLFFLRHVNKGSLLFIGRVLDPVEQIH